MKLPALIAEKTIFDLLGMLDSGERPLAFGRLVINAAHEFLTLLTNNNIS